MKFSAVQCSVGPMSNGWWLVCCKNTIPFVVDQKRTKHASDNCCAVSEGQYMLYCGIVGRTDEVSRTCNSPMHDSATKRGDFTLTSNIPQCFVCIITHIPRIRNSVG
jgi:hypothetical protein